MAGHHDEVRDGSGSRPSDGIGVARPDDIPHATEYVDADGRDDRPARRDRARRTPPTTACTCRSRRSRTTACWPTSRSTDMLAGGGEREVFGAEQKRHPADFVLWKLAKPGEPSWPSPWGEGRPGWHSECVVMSLDLLGEGFDLHAGGMDLRFPHHENERAQAVALGKRFANHWMHHGFVVDAEGEKMSKSLGNVDNLLDLLDALRRADVPRCCSCRATTAARCASARTACGAPQNALAGLDAFAARSASVGPTSRDDADPEVLAAFVERMDDDLDTPGAMAVLFDTVRRANTALDERARRTPRARSPRRARDGERGRVGARSRRRRAGRRPRQGGRRSTRRGRPRTTPRPTPSGPSCRPRGGSSRPPPKGPPSGVEPDRDPIHADDVHGRSRRHRTGATVAVGRPPGAAGGSPRAGDRA